MILSLIPWSLVIDGAVALVLAFGAAAVIPNPLRDKIRQLIRIKAANAKNAATTPVQRELELIARPQKIIEDARLQVNDLQAKLLQQRIVLDQRRDDLNAATANYYKATDEKASDRELDDQASFVADKEEEVAIEQRTFDSLEQAVSSSLNAVAAASRELRTIQLKVRSDEAKEIATKALDNATKVIEAAQSLGGVTGALTAESRAVDLEYERAKAGLETTQGSDTERELRNLKKRDQLDSVRKRLNEGRAKATAPLAAEATASTGSR
jgi:hypothetical protein